MVGLHGVRAELDSNRAVEGFQVGNPLRIIGRAASAAADDVRALVGRRDERAPSTPAFALKSSITVSLNEATRGTLAGRRLSTPTGAAIATPLAQQAILACQTLQPRWWRETVPPRLPAKKFVRC